jgi:hypothetical protein
MCPACIANTVVMIAGAGSTGGILAVCIGRFSKVFKANRPGLFQKTKERIRWRQAQRETGNTGKGIWR